MDVSLSEIRFVSTRWTGWAQYCKGQSNSQSEKVELSNLIITVSSSVNYQFRISLSSAAEKCICLYLVIQQSAATWGEQNYSDIYMMKLQVLFHYWKSLMSCEFGLLCFILNPLRFSLELSFWGQIGVNPSKTFIFFITSTWSYHSSQAKSFWKWAASDNPVK